MWSSLVSPGPFLQSFSIQFFFFFLFRIIYEILRRETSTEIYKNKSEPSGYLRFDFRLFGACHKLCNAY